MKNPEIVTELKKLSVESGGILTAEAVVEAASNPDSVLHSQFMWNDSEAAHQYRLWQARQLIRVVVDVIDNGKDKILMNVFVSLTPDREKENGGYRRVVDVISDESLYQVMLNDALEELKLFEKKYSRIKELQGVFSESRKVSGRRKAA